MTLPPPTPQPGLATNVPGLNTLQESEVPVYYYLNLQENPSYSGTQPDPSQVKRFLSKEQYDEIVSSEREAMAANQNIFVQQNAALIQEALSERDHALELLAEATGLTVEQLQSLF